VNHDDKLVSPKEGEAAKDDQPSSKAPAAKATPTGSRSRSETQHCCCDPCQYTQYRSERDGEEVEE